MNENSGYEYAVERITDSIDKPGLRTVGDLPSSICDLGSISPLNWLQSATVCDAPIR